MGNNNGENRVPVIDLEEFPGQSRKLIEACEGWGCFRVINYDNILPASLMSEMKHVLKSLFDLPLEIKKKNKDVLPLTGYVALSPNNPLFEAFGIFDMFSPKDVESFCIDLDATPHQRETILKYAKAVHEMMIEVGRKIGDGMGLKVDDVFEEWACLFKVNKYHFAPENIDCPALQMHTDSGFLTVLQDDECVGGLEVMNKSGEFVAVDPFPGSLVINLGDMAAVWSNGRFCNARHRVMCKEATTRYAIVSFLLGPREKAIETPPEFVGPDQKPLYVPVTYQQIRNLRVENNMHAGQVLDLLRAPPHS